MFVCIYIYINMYIHIIHTCVDGCCLAASGVPGDCAICLAPDGYSESASSALNRH